MNETFPHIILNDLEYFDTPFPHIIINNILPESIYKEQMNFFNNYKGCRWTSFENRFGEDIKDQKFNSFIEKCLKPQIVSFCKEIITMRNKLAKNDHEKVNIDHNNMKWVECKRCEDRSGYSINIHPDCFQKIISIIIYMNGKGSGTFLWDTTKSKSYEIIPKPNTALVFVPMQGLTYHSVPENKVNDRQTIQMTLRKK